MYEGYEGANWIEKTMKKEMSELGKAAADLLGDVYLGIYHLSRASLLKVEWNCPHQIQISVYGEMATVDSDLLTRLVVLAHDRMIRVSIEGLGPNYLRLIFHKRSVREGRLFERCPTMEDHIAIIRNHYEIEPHDIAAPVKTTEGDRS